MDKALKQRLVGASVLIALAVIVLPMLLGGPADTGQQPSQTIELPSTPEGVNFETRRFPLADETAGPAGRSPSVQQEEIDDNFDVGAPTEPPEAVPVEEPGYAPPAAADDEQSGLAPTPGEPQHSGPGNAAGEGDLVAATGELEGRPPVTSVELQPGEKVDLPVAVAPVEAPSQPMAEAVAEPSGSVASSPKSGSGRYAVQVASLSSEANSRKLQADLEGRGYTVIADRIESDVGRLHRVRVGPFNSEAEATAAAKKIQGQVEGVSPRTVDLDPAASSQVVNPSDPLVRWVVQLGSFGETTNADNLVKQVRAQGMSAYSELVTSSSGAAINRVRVGPFLQREDASKAQQTLKSSLGVNGVVMSAE
jgi:DedD protein